MVDPRGRGFVLQIRAQSGESRVFKIARHSEQSSRSNAPSPNESSNTAIAEAPPEVSCGAR